ncbi:MAG: radical SAM protein [Selenomonadaceae bacterium]|nr:radical SAM protein [Selenomonadaceae bacterium]
MKRFAIWGTGFAAKKAYRLLKAEGFDVAFFADRDINRQGQTLFNLPIKSPEALLTAADNGEINAVVLAFRNVYFKETSALFKDYNDFELYVIPTYVQVFFDRYESMEKCLIKVEHQKPRIKQFDVNLVDHCNMKCRGCLRLSNLVKEPFYADFNRMIKDFKRMKELFWGVERLKLMGGEPMLSPDLCDYIKEARRIFPDADIMVTTNALLINEDCKELFKAMRENYVFFDISLYPPMEKRIAYVEDVLQSEGVWYFINHSKGNFYKVMSSNPDYDMDEAYDKCTAKNCHHLRDGKLSTCSRPQYAHIMNERYGVDIPTWDGVWDIYNLNMDLWELDAKLSKGFEACKYCAPPHEFKWDRADDKTAEMGDWFVDVERK